MQRIEKGRRAVSSAAFLYQKHYVHNISVVHVDGGEGGIRAPVTPAYSLSRGGKGGYLSGKNGDVYVVSV